ncbi:MAG: AraC family transcriptional regulator [Lachnospiraceae bacterium]|nr:AraC family transcriptional regulator [Lachnospiraceae bacterium]
MRQEVDILRYNECLGKHFHDYPQILVPLHKKMNLIIGSEEYDITSQQLCLIPERMNHQCDYYGELLVLNLSEDMDEKDKAFLNAPLIISMRGEILALVQLIQTELETNPGGSSVKYLYNFLYSKLMENSAPQSIRYISEHYDMPITVDQLAEMESYNVTYYNDWFKQQTGTSPGMYLRKIRIDKAKEMLKTTRFGVTDIAVMVGYSSNSTFTRAFRSITGMTPKGYRENTLADRKMA